MTYEQIMAKRPGPELDALVDMIIFKNPPKYGCFLPGECDGGGCVFNEGNPHDCSVAEDLVSEGYGRNDCKYWQRVEPSPRSTDISASWEVVEKFDNMTFRRGREADGHIRHFAYIWLSETSEEHVMCKADTMPEAICKAALLAKLKGGTA